MNSRLSAAQTLDIPEKFVIPFGHDINKIDYHFLEHTAQSRGDLVLVSAMTPTPAGEGKTTVSIGLADAFKRIGRRAVLSLREPSMGPFFGKKGGATGGGRASLTPADRINLMFTGDFPAITSAHNLLRSAIENHIYFRKSPRLDPGKILFPRVIDLNDRFLRHIVSIPGEKSNGYPLESHFDITAASEVMAILALSKNFSDLKERLGRILVGLDENGNGVYADRLGVTGAMAVILRDAIHPNLVQTLEGSHAFVHTGPFANIAHGSSSILATEMALRTGEIAITEAGFGFDLGAEKFFDITCRAGGFSPGVCVLVVTARALKMHGGIKDLDRLHEKDVKALRAGFCNMEKHIENIAKFKIPVVVAVNNFEGDSEDELQAIETHCDKLGVSRSRVRVFQEGGDGGVDLAERVNEILCEKCQNTLKPLYELRESPEVKIEKIAREIYGAEHVDYTEEGLRDLKMVYNLGYDKLAVCIAKTQKSLSDNPELLGRPRDFIVTVRKIEIAAGAGFVTPVTGKILRMPGLPENPSYLSMDLDDRGNLIRN